MSARKDPAARAEVLPILIFQLADSAFPAGGFAHSLGLEALRAHGQLRTEEDLVLRLRELAWHTAYATLPFLRFDAFDDADRACDRFLAGHVANRASRAQGRALLLAAEAMDIHATLPLGHWPVALGAVLAGRASLDQARELAMFGALRSAMSAAVRLGVIGPLRAQKLLLDVEPVAREALAEVVDTPRSIAPLVELAQGAHDRLYARLFQS